MSEQDIRELVWRVANESAARGPGWAQEGVVLRTVRDEVARDFGGRPDQRTEQAILNEWHDLFFRKEARLGLRPRQPQLALLSRAVASARCRSGHGRVFQHRLPDRRQVGYASLQSTESLQAPSHPKTYRMAPTPSRKAAARDKRPPSSRASLTHRPDSHSGRTKTGLPWEIRRGDAKDELAEITSDRFSCVVTSPPYYSQRDYRVTGQIGLEKTISEYVDRVVGVFEEVKRVLMPEGTLFLNLGDTYYSGKGQPVGNDRKNGARRFGLRPVDASRLGVPRKTAIGIPWRIALKMIDKGWTLRSPIVWLRNNAIPEPTASDRPWRTYEMIFMFVKGPKYYFSRDDLAGEEDVWRISTRPTHAKGVHSAAFPDELVQKCLNVGCKPAGEVLDPFAGSGTVPRVALSSNRPAFGIDLNEEYCTHMIRALSKL